MAGGPPGPVRVPDRDRPPGHGEKERVMKTVITYGTFDILHAGHINLLRRARALGDRWGVGLPTDAFNRDKHTCSLLTYENRRSVLEAGRCGADGLPEHRG